MESFLSTLPPYVHEFLNRHPPTDVFNVLRELICFAVLYSNDREKILSITPEPVASISERILSSAARQEYEAAAAAAKPPPAAITAEPTPVSSASSSVRSATDTPPPTKSGVPYTFPEWWGHHDEPEPISMA
ncbi:hypothetical protein BDB00DRAFT_758891 [Zychaea mexicana]|uniref:uncharacterized protein n=1 Tax=Zychaea mexicana TaxID=64656 RepID=UPI0022FE3D5D|nr:uncharacterized protein BDB00DRAFT_758891 [Zychaea mexicana]KAI9496102.1 hypothetical protein BDB00DRAFT_758891 [Zychaea mexicana]